MRNSANSAMTWEWQGRSYVLPISVDDVLTLARAVDAEGSPKLSVTWALLQRAAWVNAHGQSKSLGQVVQSYAQPINPLWFPDGPKHRAEIARLEQAGDTLGAARERAKAWARVLKARKPWDELAPDTRAVITSVLAGHAPSPVTGAVHYWASRAPDFEGNQAIRPNLVLLKTNHGYDENVFFAEKGGQSFGGIQLINTENLAGANYAYAGLMGNQGAIMAGVGLALAWIAWKRKGK